MEMLGFFTTQHFYRDTITEQCCQEEIWIVSISSLITTRTYSRTAQALPLYLKVNNLRWRTPDSRYQTSEIRYLESRMLHLVQINVGSCPPMVFITNSTSAQLKCLVICHLVSEKMTPHLPRTAQSNNWLRVNFNIQQERMEYICGLSCDMGSYQDGANDDRIVSVNSEEETH